MLPTSALIVGCLSPDFEYFLRLAAKGFAGHTISGLFWFDLPLSLAVLWLWHHYVAYAVRTLAPRLFPIDQAYLIEKPLGTSLGQFALVCISVLIGAATHMVWDSFTHPVFWPYRHFPLLREMLHIGPLRIPVYKAFQHGSTIVGMSILFVIWARWSRDKARRDVPAIRSLGWFILCVALVLAALHVSLGTAVSHGSGRSGMLLSEFVITWITALWVMLVLFGCLQTPQKSPFQGNKPTLSTI